MDEVRTSLAEAAAALDDVVRHSDEPQHGSAADARIAVGQVSLAMGGRDSYDCAPRNAHPGAGGARLHLALHRALRTLQVASQTGLSARHKKLLGRAKIMVRALHSEFAHPGAHGA
jgi:hypothetical protein